MHLVGMTKAAKPSVKPERKPVLTSKLPNLVKYRTRLPGIARPTGHMTQTDLAAKTGYSQGMISQWESGESDATTENIRVLAIALEITPEQLQYRDPDKGEHIADIWHLIPEGDQPRVLQIVKVFVPKTESSEDSRVPQLIEALRSAVGTRSRKNN